MILMIARVRLDDGRIPIFGVQRMPDGSDRTEMKLKDGRVVQIDLLPDVVAAFEIEEKTA